MIFLIHVEYFRKIITRVPFKQQEEKTIKQFVQISSGAGSYYYVTGRFCFCPTNDKNVIFNIQGSGMINIGCNSMLGLNSNQKNTLCYG